LCLTLTVSEQWFSYILVSFTLKCIFLAYYIFMSDMNLKINTADVLNHRSQWPRSLRRRSTAARLLRSWVRIPPGHGCLSVVSVVCCQVEVSATN
jgi:hypothetical protein